MPLTYLRKVEEDAARNRGAGRPSRPPPAGSTRGAGISLFKAISIGLVATAMLPAIIYLPWILAMVQPTRKLPDFWARPSIKLPAPGSLTGAEIEQLGEPHCRNAFASAADPYQRPPPFQGWDPKVQTTEYCEDAEIVHSRGLILVSCDANRPKWNTVMGPLRNVKPRGALWIYDFGAAKTAPTSTPPADKLEIVKLAGFPDRFDFHPLGMSVHERDDNALRLFVVNHQRLRGTVEVFDLQRQATGWVATYVRTVVDPVATHTPNSVQATGHDSFLVTQDHLFAHRAPPADQLTRTLALALPLPSLLARLVAPVLVKVVTPPFLAAQWARIETFLGLPLSWVSHVYFDEEAGKVGAPRVELTDVFSLFEIERADADTASLGVTASIVARGIPFSNGIALSPSAGTLVVASSMYPGLFLYDVGPPPPPPPSSWERKKKAPPKRKGAAAKVQAKTDWTNKDHVRPRGKVHMPFVVDNLSFGPVEVDGVVKAPAGSAAKAQRDPFDSARLIVAGHPDALALTRFAKAPADKRRTAPSWVLSLRPSQAYLTGADKYGIDSLLDNLEHDRDAPVQANTRTLTQDPAWRLDSLLQTKGEEVTVEQQHESAAGPVKSEIRIPSSSTGVWNDGLLLVTGLYSKQLLVCSDVGREVAAA